MAAPVSGGLRRHTERGPALLGVDLRDAREEMFARMVCDGLSLGVAYARAGFTSKQRDAPYQLYHLPRIQERAQAIFEARRTTGVVTLAEVTDSLQRVFANALSEGEYSAAHNAAFSLARLYGHVTDRATLEVIRRPSRDPDAPSEQALASWVNDLPALPAPSPLGLEPLDAGLEPGPAPVEAGPNQGSEPGPNPRLSDAPAAPLGQPRPGPRDFPNDIKDITPQGPIDWYRDTAGPGPSGPEMMSDIKGLGLDGSGVGGRPENGAPTGPVTGTPNDCGPSGLLGDEGTTPPGGEEKTGPPSEPTGTGTLTGKKIAEGAVPDRQVPSFEDLFGGAA